MIPPRFAFHRLTQPTSPDHHTIEVFLDYVCPYSAKMFKTLYTSIIPLFKEHQIELLFRQQIQPWHPQSTLAHEAALAVGKLDPSKFLPFSVALFENQEKFFDINTYNKSRIEIYQELAGLVETSVGIQKESILELLQYSDGGTGSKNNGNKVTDDLKWCLKHSRHNHIHVSPTVLVDGLINDNISSSWLLPEWEKLVKSL